MSRKTRHFGRESGKSSTRWFGNSEPRGTAGGDHGYGARAGDGRTTDKGLIAKVAEALKLGDQPKRKK